MERPASFFFSFLKVNKTKQTNKRKKISACHVTEKPGRMWTLLSTGHVPASELYPVSTVMNCCCYHLMNVFLFVVLMLTSTALQLHFRPLRYQIASISRKRVFLFFFFLFSFFSSWQMSTSPRVCSSILLNMWSASGVLSVSIERAFPRADVRFS